MAFVRQRRDENDQIVHRPGPHPSPAGVHRVPRDRAAPRRSVVQSQRFTQLAGRQQNIAVDAGSTSRVCAARSALTDRPVTLYTLPITGFGQDAAGEDINIIDVPASASSCRARRRRPVAPMRRRLLTVRR